MVCLGYRYYLGASEGPGVVALQPEARTAAPLREAIGADWKIDSDPADWKKTQFWSTYYYYYDAKFKGLYRTLWTKKRYRVTSRALELRNYMLY